MALSYGILFLLLRDNTHPSAGCTIHTCPVSESTYGYLPSKPLNIIFLAIFAISFFVHLFQGIRRRAWTFLIALALGTSTEAIGYIGRLRMHNNPFNRGNLAINIVCLTVAPAFIAAGIYLALKHLVIILGTKYSRFAPKWYTRIFIACDTISFIVQTGGAALSSSTKQSLASAANGIMQAGITFQVVTLLIFGLLSLELYIRYTRSSPISISKHTGIQSTTSQPQPTPHLKKSILALMIAYFAILIRCIYRIAEMAGGWRNPIMQNQTAFVVCDGVMCVVACVVLNVFHPGEIFGMSKEKGGLVEGSGNSTSTDTNVEMETLVQVGRGKGNKV